MSNTKLGLLGLLALLLMITTGQAQEQQDKAEEIFKERTDWAIEKYQDLKISPRKTPLRKDGILRESGSASWLTPAMKEEIRKETLRRQKEAMEKGTKYQNSVVMDLYRKEYEKHVLGKDVSQEEESPKTSTNREKEKKSNLLTWILCLLIIVLLIAVKRLN